MTHAIRQISSFAAPFLFCVLFPYWLVTARLNRSGGSVFNPSLPFVLLGSLIVLVGLVGFVLTVRMLILIGKGTIMPWDPTRKLVTGSLYGYVRNPMILSVLLIVSGEAVLFASGGLALLALAFFAVNTVYFIFSEEPGLEERFGQEYVEYKRNVPRWVPRLHPWKSKDEG
jgi:protein-S-isoprenylcysteine O-methyltransferase Ste14